MKIAIKEETDRLKKMQNNVSNFLKDRTEEHLEAPKPTALRPA